MSSIDRWKMVLSPGGAVEITRFEICFYRSLTRVWEIWHFLLLSWVVEDGRIAAEGLVLWTRWFVAANVISLGGSSSAINIRGLPQLISFIRNIFLSLGYPFYSSKVEAMKFYWMFPALWKWTFSRFLDFVKFLTSEVETIEKKPGQLDIMLANIYANSRAEVFDRVSRFTPKIFCVEVLWNPFRSVEYHVVNGWFR